MDSQWVTPDGYLKDLATFQDEPTEKYAVDEFAIKGTFESYKTIDSLFYRLVTRGPANLYMFGEVKYINPVDNSTNKYVFCYIVAIKKEVDYPQRGIDSTTTIIN